MTLISYQQIVKESGLPWLPLDIDIPHQAMLEEAQNIKHLFVPHRDKDRQGGYRHKGWRSLCIHGISAEKTNHFTEYGYRSNEEVPLQLISLKKDIQFQTTLEYDLCFLNQGDLLVHMSTQKKRH